MYNSKKILSIIPARGGSKGLPGKNIKPLLDKPLIGWTIEQAKVSKYLDEIFISTDSQEIANVAKSFGVDVYELRPPELATDTSPSSAFVIHTIDFYRKKGKEFDYILLLEPTSPLRKEDDIDNMIRLTDLGMEGVVSVGEVHTEHPSIVKNINDQGIINPFIASKKKATHRQMLGKAYFPYCVGYLVKTSYFEETKLFYSENSTPYIIERWQNYEIDDIYDFICVEAIMRYRKNNIL